MSDETVEVPFGEKAGETATLLLAAAEDLDLSPDVVQVTNGAFVVPEEVQKKSGLDKASDDDDDSEESEPEQKKPTKKTAAKKAEK